MLLNEGSLIQSPGTLIRNVGIIQCQYEVAMSTGAGQAFVKVIPLNQLRWLSCQSRNHDLQGC